MFSIAVDVVRAIEEVDDLETMTLSGNTCGVDACKAIGKALATKATFKVPHAPSNTKRHHSLVHSGQCGGIYSLADCSTRSLNVWLVYIDETWCLNIGVYLRSIWEMV